MINSLDFVRSLSWSELVDIWRAKEEKVWTGYIEDKGLKDWDDYRFGPLGTFTRYGFDAFSLPEQEWKEYQMTDVHMIAPLLLTGPFRSWTKYNTQNPNASLPFIQAIQNIELQENKDIKWTMKALLEGQPSFGIGLYEPEKGLISLFDGHHTFSALTLLIEDGYEGELPQIPLFLTEVPEEAREYFYELIEGRTEPIPMQ
ncbi:MAG: hypothetical protein ACI9QC_000459 [Oceanicoccus sp.]|jgi:hypothetical protein